MLLKRFREIFQGNIGSYGQMIKPPRTVRGEASDRQWDNHFKGKIGLGIVPITKNNNCYFAVLDIDIDDIDHIALLKKVQFMRLPLIVCRSRSGAAHCYTFYRDPLNAVEVRRRLSSYASKLGYGGCEIFPKQETIKIGQFGNWINLPYFDVAKTPNSPRSAYNLDGPVDLNSFFEMVDIVMNQNSLSLSSDKLDDSDPMAGAPPCLVNLMSSKIKHGSQHNALYNFAVFFKRKFPDSWEDKIAELNYKIIDPPASIKNIQNVIKSVGLKDYNYKCEEKPIISLCDRIECVTREFGVSGHLRTYETMTVGGLSKIMTDPPRWIIEINGIELTLSTIEIMNYMKMRIKCMEAIDIIAPPMKQEDWLQIIKDRIKEKVNIDAPDDTGFTGQIKPTLLEFLAIGKRSKSKNDVERGMPAAHIVDKKEVMIFRSSDFIAYAKRNRIDLVVGPELWLTLRGIGCGHCKIKINKKATQVWYLNRDDIQFPTLNIIEERPEI